MPCVGFLIVSLLLAENSSLKDKRRVVKSVLARVRSRFNASCAEVDYQDNHQEARLGFSVCGSNGIILRTVLNRIIHFIEDNADAELSEYELYCPLIPDTSDEDDDYCCEDDGEAAAEIFGDEPDEDDEAPIDPKYPYRFSLEPPEAPDPNGDPNAYQAVLKFSPKASPENDIYFSSSVPIPILSATGRVEDCGSDEEDSKIDYRNNRHKHKEYEGDFSDRQPLDDSGQVPDEAEEPASGDENPKDVLTFNPRPRTPSGG
jgi:uncharacterized protein YlxP (DUF503 family)